MTTLSDRVAVVTGAAHGIGHAIAVALATAGADVVAVDIDKAGAEKTAAAVAAAGRRSLTLATDVGDVASIDQMVSQVTATFGRIDILVNNAGVTRRAYIMDLTEGDWDRIMRVNGKGVFFCLQRVAREMIPRRSGVIINIASIAGKGYAGTSNAIYAGEQGRGHRHDAHRRAPARPPQHQRQRHLPGQHGHRAVQRQPEEPREGGGRQRRGDGAPPQRRHPARPRQRPGGHRGHGRVPRLCRAPATSPGSPSTWTAASSSTEPSGDGAWAGPFRPCGGTPTSAARARAS